MAGGGNSSIESILAAYSSERAQNADAISQLALDHYHDMASRTANPLSQLRRRALQTLHRLMPSMLVPLYSLVAFTNTPYAVAVARAHRQDQMVAAGLSLAAAVAATAVVGVWVRWGRT
mmetsp:Transcript_268/g.458  ORF Transcript_268/g.458 Transcript_268/m.458 type:complete len:119 (+) Transcript_268:1387-1743(+)